MVGSDRRPAGLGERGGSKVMISWQSELVLGPDHLSIAVSLCEGSHHCYQDSWLVWPLAPDRLRLAVIDGVTPWRARSYAGVDAARYAAGLTRVALSSRAPLREAMRAANSALYDPGLAVSRSAAMAAMVGVDLTVLDNRLLVSAAAAADCEAWVLGAEGGWRLLAGGRGITATARARWASWLDDHPEAGFDERTEAESAALAGRDAWASTALGRFPEPLLEEAATEFVGGIVLASDGARLSREALSDLSTHLDAVMGASERDDVTVIAVQSVRQ